MLTGSLVVRLLDKCYGGEVRQFGVTEGGVLFL